MSHIPPPYVLQVSPWIRRSIRECSAPRSESTLSARNEVDYDTEDTEVIEIDTDCYYNEQVIYSGKHAHNLFKLVRKLCMFCGAEEYDKGAKNIMHEFRSTAISIFKCWSEDTDSLLDHMSEALLLHIAGYYKIGKQHYAGLRRVYKCGSYAPNVVTCMHLYYTGEKLHISQYSTERSLFYHHGDVQ